MSSSSMGRVQLEILYVNEGSELFILSSMTGVNLRCTDNVKDIQGA